MEDFYLVLIQIAEIEFGVIETIVGVSDSIIRDCSCVIITKCVRTS